MSREVSYLWSVFLDIFIARTNEKHSEVAASYIENEKLVELNHIPNLKYEKR